MSVLASPACKVAAKTNGIPTHACVTLVTRVRTATLTLMTVCHMTAVTMEAVWMGLAIIRVHVSRALQATIVSWK